MARITIRDIARKAGVSPTAVSFVLNNRPGVSAETRERVQRIIEQEGFTPNRTSRRLALNKSYNIAFLFDEAASPFSNMFYWGLAGNVLGYCNANGYNLVLAEVEDDNHVPEIIREQDVDGVLCFQRVSAKVREVLLNQDIPYVIVDSHEERQRTEEVSIYADYVESVQTAFRFLYEQGMREIALIVSSYVPGYHHDICEGYRESLSAYGLAFREEYLRSDAKDAETGYECMKCLLSGPARPDAVICAGDIFAIGAILCARDAGLRVPEDISLISIDDLPISRYIDPPLTAVHIDQREMGVMGITELLGMIGGQEGASHRIISNRLIVRRSVRMKAERNGEP